MNTTISLLVSLPNILQPNLFSYQSFTGGGTAGCVLANRLSASPNTAVLLVERGPLADSWASRVPLLSSDFASNGSRTQKRQSDYQPELGRPIELIVGSALGGSSRINQMLYTRGLKKEYDIWEESGCPGWGWKDVGKCFMKSERAPDHDADPNVHGTNGVSTSRLNNNEFIEFSFLFVSGEWCNRGPGNDLHFPGFN